MTNLAFTWTPASASEFTELIALVQDFYVEEQLNFDATRAEQSISELFSHPELGHIFLLKHGSEPVGYMVATIGFSLEFGGRFALLDELYLSPVCRGQGQGKQALVILEYWAKQQGFATTRLEVNHHNDNAAAIYIKTGYVDEQRRILTKWLG